LEQVKLFQAPKPQILSLKPLLTPLQGLAVPGVGRRSATVSDPVLYIYLDKIRHCDTDPNVALPSGHPPHLPG